MVELNAEQTKKVESLVAMGLPEAQAKISAATDAGPVVETRKVSTLVTLKSKEGANLEELKPLFAEYTKNSAASGGKVSPVSTFSHLFHSFFFCLSFIRIAERTNFCACYFFSLEL